MNETESKRELYHFITVVGGVFGPLLCFGIATGLEFFGDDTWFVNLVIAWEVAALVAWLGPGGRSVALDGFLSGTMFVGLLACIAATMVFLPLGCSLLGDAWAESDGEMWLRFLALLGFVPPLSLVAFGWNTRKAMSSMLAGRERILPWFCFALGAAVPLGLGFLAMDSGIREAWQSTTAD